MSDGATLPDLDIDDLAMAARHLLEQFRKRGLDDVIQRKLVGSALDAENVEKLNSLIAKFEAAMMPTWRLPRRPWQRRLLAYLMLQFLQIRKHHFHGIRLLRQTNATQSRIRN